MNSLNSLPLSDNLKNTLTGLIEKDRLPHAILLESEDTELRSKVSLYLAAAFVCSGEEKPCFRCANCSKAESGSHPDIVVSDPAQFNEKTFKISLVRDIRTDAFIIPNEASRKVYILKSADKMNIQAQNALLKIIEEPPPYVRFILECESRAAMLDTIMSRVTPFNLGAGSRELSDEYMQKADGIADKLASALLEPTELGFMRLSSEFEKDKELFEAVLPLISLIFRDAAVISAGGKSVLSSHSGTSRMLASKFPVRILTELVKNCNHFNDCITRNANRNLLITRFCSIIRQTAYGG